MALLNHFLRSRWNRSRPAFPSALRPPVDSAKQLWVDYLRSNALGLYRNEGTDGHELNIKMRQDGVYKDGKRTLPLHGFEFSYFSSRSGQNGGLNSSDFFESNVPTLRRNYSVANDRGELYEEQLRFMYYRHLSDVTLKAQLKSAAWAVQSDLHQYCPRNTPYVVNHFALPMPRS